MTVQQYGSTWEGYETPWKKKKKDGNILSFKISAFNEQQKLHASK